MTRLMYDSTTAADIPAEAEMVAGYVDLWSAQDWARFPNATKLRIARNINEDGDVGDCETGDLTPAQCPAWTQRQRAAWRSGSVYVDVSNWPAVRNAFALHGIALPPTWVANYDNVATIPAGAVAKQYINPPGSGGHFDLSVVADHWPGVDPNPVIEDADMASIRQVNWNGQQHTLALVGSTLFNWYADGALPELVADNVVDFDVDIDASGANTPGNIPEVRVGMRHVDGSVSKSYQVIGKPGWAPVGLEAAA